MPPRTALAAAAGYAALAVTDTYLAGRQTKGARRLRYLTKPLLMPTLAAAFASATEGRTDALRQGTLAAQACSWGGDVALLGKGDRALLTGVGSFAAAHAAFITGFGSAHAARDEIEPAGIKAAGTFWATAAPVIGYAARRKSPELAMPIVGYGGILASMFAASTTLDPAIRARARSTIKAGTALFLVSDLLLGVQKFLLRSPHPVLESAVMGTYTASQGLIALGVADASRAPAPAPATSAPAPAAAAPASAG